MPDLIGAGSVAEMLPLPTQELRATYYDTVDRRLARWGITLRHRTGEGDRAAWTLKLPTPAADVAGVTPASREEMEIEGGPGTIPEVLVDLVTAHVRSHPLAPAAVLATTRAGWRLVAGDGHPVAELTTDDVSVMEGGDPLPLQRAGARGAGGIAGRPGRRHPPPAGGGRGRRGADSQGGPGARADGHRAPGRGGSRVRAGRSRRLGGPRRAGRRSAPDPPPRPGDADGIRGGPPPVPGRRPSPPQRSPDARAAPGQRLGTGPGRRSPTARRPAGRRPRPGRASWRGSGRSTATWAPRSSRWSPTSISAMARHGPRSSTSSARTDMPSSSSGSSCWPGTRS